MQDKIVQTGFALLTAAILAVCSWAYGIDKDITRLEGAKNHILSLDARIIALEKDVTVNKVELRAVGDRLEAYRRDLDRLLWSPPMERKP